MAYLTYHERKYKSFKRVFCCRSLTSARSGGNWFSKTPDQAFTEATWWELTVLPMLAYMLWAVAYYVKVHI